MYVLRERGRLEERRGDEENVCRGRLEEVDEEGCMCRGREGG